MARLQRAAPAGVPIHIIQRGNNKQVCFTNNKDMMAYHKWLTDFANQYGIAIHAGVLMTNHIHLLCTPSTNNAISKMMQSLGRMYAGYFNHTYQRTGTLWEGRFKSCLVQSEQYLLQLHQYIELNPVRAGMVEHPSEYSWSSYNYNALGIANNFITPHPEYLYLGNNNEQRQQNYRALFEHAINHKTLDNIRQGINKGLALGSQKFVDEIEQLTNKRISSRMAGRPRKNENK